MAHRNGHRQQQQTRPQGERGLRAEERFVEERDRGFGAREDEGRHGALHGQGGRGLSREEQGYYGEGRPMYGPEDRGPSYGGRGSDESWEEERFGPASFTGGRGSAQGGYSSQRVGQQGQYGGSQYGAERTRGGFEDQSEAREFQGGGYRERSPEGSYGGGRERGAYAPGTYGQGGGLRERTFGGGAYDEGAYGQGSSWRGSQDQGFYGQHGGAARGLQSRGRHYGKSPQGYSRSDDRIREEVCDLLMQGHVDPSQITVRVQNGEVTLEGRVERREDKYRVEDLAESVLGVKDVENRLKVSRERESEGRENQDEKTTTTSGKSASSRGHSS